MATGDDLSAFILERPDVALTHPSYRVLLVAGEADRRALGQLIGARLPAWDVVEAESIERARFALQLETCDVVVLDAGLARPAHAQFGIADLRPLPITLLVDGDADFLSAALEYGVTNWIPRRLALRHAGLLSVILRRAAMMGELRRNEHASNRALADCRRHVDRLVNRLWETVPSELGANWFTQRHMLERLQEEVQRVKRHGGPLTVVLGELGLAGGGNDDPAALAARLVSRCKRRTDVAGQYGPHGFLLLLPGTPESGAVRLCQRLRMDLEQGRWQAYFGLAALEDAAATTSAQLLSRAEERLEEARAGRSLDRR
jgi:GGDEF domain-containing protein